MFTEIAPGTEFQWSTGDGQLNVSHTRVFKLLLNEAGEVFDIQKECNTYIGDQHPINKDLYCARFDARYDGDSRMVVLVTFTYEAHASNQQDGEDPNKNPPDVRPANWSISSSLVEVPAYEWLRVADDGGPMANGKGWERLLNPAGDLYEGVTKLEPMVTITIEQFEANDPTTHCLNVGSVNKEEFAIGSLTCPKRTVMFRGVSSRPHVEAWGQQGQYRGWMGTFEFVFRRNYVDSIGQDIGWDRAEPQVGYNIINVEGALGGGDNEIGALALAHTGAGKIKNWPDDPDLAEGTKDQKVRAMVLVNEHDINGVGQRPATLPIPLNDDGTPRSRTADPPVHVYRYQIYPEVDFRETFNLRLDSY